MTPSTLTRHKVEDLEDVLHDAAQLAKESLSPNHQDRGDGTDAVWQEPAECVELDITDAVGRYVRDMGDFAGQSVRVKFSEVVIEGGRVVVRYEGGAA